MTSPSASNPSPDPPRKSTVVETDQRLAQMADLLRADRPNEDSTEHHRFTEALEAAAASFRRLLESSAEGLLILDADSGLILDLNPVLVELLGYRPDELVGQVLWQAPPFRNLGLSPDAIERLRRERTTRFDELPLAAGDGHTVPVELVSHLESEFRRSPTVHCRLRDLRPRHQALEAIDRANQGLTELVAEVERSSSELHLIQRMSELLQTCERKEEAYQVIALVMKELYADHHGCLAVYAEQSTSLEVAATWGDESRFAFTFPQEDCWGIRRGQPHDVPEPGAGMMCRHFTEPGEACTLCVPLAAQGETFGLLSLLSGFPRGPRLRWRERKLARTVGESIKLSLSNLALREKLREQAVRDPLTGLHNRRFLDEVLPRELHRSRRSGSPLCLAMLDIDHFKEFNDKFGHDSGDRVLCEVAGVFGRCLRQADLCCRFGGEEFVLVLPDCSLEDGRRRIEEVCGLVRKMEIVRDGRLLRRVTLSAGLAEVPRHGTSVEMLLNAADEALYGAKKAGRDRVRVAGQDRPDAMSTAT